MTNLVGPVHFRIELCALVVVTCVLTRVSGFTNGLRLAIEVTVRVGCLILGVWFLTRWSRSTRLDTRTKEFDMCASFYVLNYVTVMKVNARICAPPTDRDLESEWFP